MRYTLLFILLFCSGFSAFSGIFFSPQERAYLFHVVKKNQVLDRNIGEFFKYEGEWITVQGQIDFDTLEQIVITEPTLLDIDFEGIKRAPESILAETASKMGLWKLVQILDHPGESAHQTDYNLLVKYLKQQLPDGAYQDRERTRWHKQIRTLLNADLSLLDKRDIVEEIERISLKEKMYILEALDASYKHYTNKLTRRYFDLLGGSNTEFENVLLAAGEGSKTYGLMEEFEKNENGKLNKKQPKGIALFTYQYSIKKSRNGMRDIYPKTDPVIAYHGFNDPENTNVHLSLWGFDAFFQTTVVLKTGGRSYILYANRDSKELSADSAYAYGKTYQYHINTLEKKIIPEIEEDLHGKSGLWVQHARWEERRVKYYDEIRKAEVAMRTYELEKNKKKLKKAQDRYLNYNTAYANARTKKRKTFHRIYAKEQELEYYQDQLFYMKSNLGSAPVDYVYEDSLYKFEDGSYFDPFTQDFHFNSIDNGEFNVRLISIGSKPLADLVDEVQLMVNAMHKSRPNQIKFDFNLEDSFDPNSYRLKALPEAFTKSGKLDSILNYLVDHTKEGRAYLFGGGVGSFGVEGDIISDTAQTELDKYPGLTQKEKTKNRNKPEFKSLRSTKVSIYIDGSAVFKISSYTDPVISTLSEQDSSFKALKDSLHFESDNELLSCLRSLNTFDLIITNLQKRLSSRHDIDVKTIARVSEALTRTREKGVVKYANGPQVVSFMDYQKLQSKSD